MISSKSHIKIHFDVAHPAPGEVPQEREEETAQITP